MTNDQAQLKSLASKKLATIVKERITDLKDQQSGSGKITNELNFNFDIPDFTQLNVAKDNQSWSYTYHQKPRTAVKIVTVPKPPTSSCKDVKEKKATKLVETNGQVIIEPEVREERVRGVPVTKTLKIVRI
jgi:hypothetical protein